MKLSLVFFLISILFCSYQKSKQLNATLVLDAKTKLGEGALWHPIENKLYWVDIEGKALHIYNPSTKKDIKFFTGARIGTVVPVLNGGALVALQTGFHAINTKTGKLTFITNPLKDSSIRFNDGKCDPSGRFWVGTMHLNYKKDSAVLYRVDTNKIIHLMLNRVTISNGIAWSADKKTMYYIDSPTSSVQAFEYNDTTGDISNRRVVIQVPQSQGTPDGMTIDAEGNLWIALWGGGTVSAYNPATGKRLKKITVPAPNVTSCAFGGTKLTTLYITTAREGLNADQLKQYPKSGGLFAARPGVKGIRAQFFKGKL